ncbi:MAG: MotA/TolQ/ExbB proton channel family protein [Polyangia bacterium]
MDLGALIKSVIYVVSSSLLYPTLLLLSLLSIWILFHAGGFVAEWIERIRLRRPKTARLAAALRDEENPRGLSLRTRAFLVDLRRLLSGDHSPREALVAAHLDEAVARAYKSLDRVRLVTRIGPGLGLIGTLIPMGTGLAALGEGDLTRLSSDLVIAFTTTVVGLALGITSFFFYTLRKRWIDEDVRAMELAAELLSEDEDGSARGEV